MMRRIPPMLMKKKALQLTRPFHPSGLKAFSTFHHHQNARDEYSTLPFVLTSVAFGAVFMNKAYCEEEGKPPLENSQQQPAKVEDRKKRKRWGLDLPQMPWAHKVDDGDEEYEKQNHWQVEQAILTTAPNVPPPITRRHHALVKVDLTTELKKFQLNSKYKYEGW